MYQPVVSVVIPTFNRYSIIHNALDSVMKQTYQNFEIIVIDDGSTQPICNLETEYPRVRVIRHEINLGQVQARNTGIYNARGFYVAQLDSDDVWLPSKLEKQVSFMQDNPLLDATTTGYFYNTEEGNSVEIPKRQKDWFHFLSSGVGLGTGTTMLVKRECIIDIGFDPTFPRLVDLDFMLRFVEKYHFDVIQEPLAIVNRNGRPSASSVEEANIRFVEKHQTRLLKYGRWYRSYCIAKRWLEVATHYFREKNSVRGWHYLGKVLSTNPFQRPSMYLRIFDYLLGTSILITIKQIWHKCRG